MLTYVFYVQIILIDDKSTYLKILFVSDSNCFGIVIEVKLLQLQKAKFPIDVTESGIIIEVKLLQL